MRRTQTLLVLALPWCIPALSQAQLADETKAEERWYQVELLVFSRRDTSTKPPTEQWRSDISLEYPDNWVLLQSPEQYEGELQRLAEKRKQALDMDRFFDFTDEPYNEAGDKEIIDSEKMPVKEDIDSNSDATSPIIDALSPDFTDPVYDPEHDPEQDSEQDPVTEELVTTELRPYLFLPHTEHTLQEQADSLQKDKRFNLLFHQAWRQAPKVLSETPALIISGGHQYGEHSELEGSIKLSIARYLHLNTNLWLSEFEPNYGQNTAQSIHSLTDHAWPELPKVPNIEDSNENFALSTNDQGWQASLNLNALSGGDEYNAILAKPYLTSNIVKLTQSRRMRSNEVHYIDHPRMGIIIKLTPFERTSDLLEEGDNEEEE